MRSIKQIMDSDWNNSHEVTINEIIHVIKSVSPEKNNAIKDRIHKLSETRKKSITKHMQNVQEEQLKHEQQSYENEVIALNTILIRDVLDEIEVSIPAGTSFMLGGLYLAHSCDSALEILQNSKFKDKHHHKGNKYDSLHSFKEHMDIVRNSFRDALIKDGIGKNNANRISTKLTAKLRDELKPQLNL